MKELLAELGAAGELVTDPDVLRSFSRDQASPEFTDAGVPLAMVRPRDTAEVRAAVRAASRHGVPIVPRGAGSGLSGGANAIDGCLVVCLDQMDRLLEIDQSSQYARVEPGLVNARLREAAAAAGLFYAPDPASFEFSTLGGNVATNAGGLCCVKYGVTREALLGLRVVLADGNEVRLGGTARKDVAGYDLAALFCGSEGTLGIVTEATLRLLPEPAPAATLAAGFETIAAAGAAVARIRRETVPALLELMDRTTIAAVERFAPQGLEDTGALVFARSDLPGAAALAEVERMGAWCEEAGATIVATTDEAAEGRALMNARRLAYPALEREGSVLLDDVSVPGAAIVDLLTGIEEIAARNALTVATFGHAGDGNMHPTIVYDAVDPDSVRRASGAFKEIVALALRLGGSASGEHGIGLLKSSALDAQLGPTRELHRRVKRVFDPAGIMNPGKAI